ncbi:hypothetical protein DRN73_09805 [Candidatus Pacearchaeota archaeon]|nr:MAG: hypothetical protein DRN73_09805 [Candidatus Pacearchaeota archaeon]
MGIWQGLNIIKSYTSYTNLGVSKAAAREIAYLRGKGEYKKAEDLKNVGFTFTLIMIFIFGFICMSAVLFPQFRSNIYLSIGFIVMGIILILERIESYLITILRAKKKFYVESLVKIVNSILNIVLVIVVVRIFKLFGLYASYIFLFCASIFLIVFVSKESFKFILDKRDLFHLIKIGVPLVGLGFMFTNLTNIDRILILKMLGARSLGLYSIALMMGNFTYQVSNMAGIVLYPRFQEMYAQLQSRKKLFEVMRRIIKFLSIPILILVLGAIFFMPFIVKIFLPKYIEGINCMRIFLCGVYFLSLSMFCNHFLITINRQSISLIICISCAVLNLFLNIWFIKNGWSIEGVATATSISYLIYFILLISASVKFR